MSRVSAYQTLPTRRLNRIRFSWFVIGVSFGAFIALALHFMLSIDRNGAMALLQQWDTPAPQFTEIEPAAGEAEKAITEPTAPLYPAELSLKVHSGDTLISMLTAKKVSYDEAHNAVEAIRKVYNPRKINAGQQITLKLDRLTNQENPNITALSINVSPAYSVRLVRLENGNFRAEEVKTPMTKSLSRAGGFIVNSFYETGVNSGVPASLLGEVINAYSYDVDFQRDIKSGDAVDVVFEEYKSPEGIRLQTGEVVYAALTLGGKEMRVYRYTDKEGTASYYNEKGESVKKALLKTPINGARISSGFGMRHHPVLGYSKMHKGVDFAAVTGTPIYAAGDGMVKEAGPKGSYGNYLRIAHNGTFATAYAHISRFAKGLRAGMKVKQGQVVAYVGTTGRSTGPHLHYEVLKNGAQVNPSAMKFKTGNTLAGKQLAEFKTHMAQINTLVASLPKRGGAESLAMAVTGKNSN